MLSAKKKHEIQEQVSVDLTGIDAVRYIRRQMKMHEALGIHEYPLNADMARFLELTDPANSTVSPPPTVSSTPHINPGKGVDLKLLEDEMRSCTLCRLAAGKQGTVQGSGNKTCRLMVIGDWSLQSEKDFNADILFGPGEDGMLWKMMAAITLTRDEVYVTNCIKCCPGPDVSPDEQSEKSCFSFLEREVATVQPDVICTMGEVAARVITGSTDPLTRLRGKFQRYRYEPARRIDVMPTFHPRFLLKFPDLKKATWLDLQAVKRHLAEKQPT